MYLLVQLQRLLDKTRAFDFLGPLALRLYLVPIFWMAGTKKLADMDSIIAWFGNTEWGLGLPFPEVMAWAAALTETAGAIMLLVGFAVRWISIPLMVTMVVAIVTVHLPNGWLAIAEGSGPFATERTMAAIERLDRAKEILQQYGNYDWLTEYGNFVVLNNGIEFAVTYFIMLLVLFFIGGGRYFSMDYWIRKAFMR
ncbi:putative membrane protein YphA (DoxX/SURF4 family) [Thiogranum longum]|uniref:Putative membrane protein YphA (DoxX/SURF4 family) n=1 Tax=Thiogranum longum TaxID=1537524 RepID=A0A4R1HBK1_9GAMM|nr:DoxX family protein [Thiogranum longum]TCK18778.1 putative membrane protein YphA (DoxX/SURF4 family) [Thiogranum longum]